jgi:Undecaprenyl-phosphate galactose phosphotransferase WbaP
MRHPMDETSTIERRSTVARPVADPGDHPSLGESPAANSAVELPTDRTLARAARVAVLCATDFCALVIACVIAYLLWALPERGQSIRIYLTLAPLLTLFVVGYAQAGLYPGFGLGPVEVLRRVSYVTTSGFVVLGAITFALKLPAVYSRVTFFLAFGSSLLTVPICRAIVSRLARASLWWSEPVLVIGTGTRAARAIRGLRNVSALGYRPIAVLTLAPRASAATFEGVPIHGDLSNAPRLAMSGIQVVLAETDRALDSGVIAQLQRSFRHVVLLRNDDLPVEGVQVRNLGGIVGIEYTNNLLLPANRAIKRAIDVSLAIVSLVVAAPIAACAAALVTIVDGPPMFFRQDRSGLDGRRITVPKIRTMKRGAEEELERQLDADPALRREWEERHKLKNDPRLIPAIGRLFRRYSIDELPQLWAVLDGRMSLVGPRPFPDDHLKRFSPDFHDLRQRVRPGITGLWQVNVRSDGDIDQQETYDTYYIRNWSVWLDIYILSRTIAAVVSGRGAY